MTSAPLAASHEHTNVPRALAWAAYLGASWTWVIGMFLPVLLIRDFGPTAWVVFAIPNVVGAAAMGWTIRSREHSEAFVANHGVATRAFSVVTIAFHFYVLLWLLPRLIGPAGAAIVFGAALTVAMPLLSTTIRATTLAIAALVASVLIATTLAGVGALGWPRAPGVQPTLDLVALAPVCLLGFLTCPYLDLTFHQGRQACRTRGESKLAFGVGFGVCFCAMIVLTFLYARVFYASPDATGVPRVMIAAHLAIQSILTVGLHASSLRRAWVGGSRPTAAILVGIVAAVAAALTVHVAWTSKLGAMSVGEVCYRLFLAFYGLIAPAYLLVCVRRADASPEPRDVGLATIAAIVAAPFFWVGFMHASMRWAMPGVAVLLVAWIVVTVRRRGVDARDRALNSLRAASLR